MFTEKKMKLIEVQTLANAIGNFNQTAEDQGGVSAKLAYKMARLAAQVSKPLETLEEQRNALFKKYGEEKDGQITIPEKNVKKFQKEMSDLLETEEEIKVLSDKIKVSELEGLKLKPSFMFAFSEYLED